MASYKIEPLTRNNYDTWKLQAQAVLIKNNLWDYVNGAIAKPENCEEKIEWQKCDASAKADLMLVIAPSELKQIKNCQSSKDIWDTLNKIYQSSGPARKATLLKKLILTKMSADQDVRTHLNMFMDTVDKLLEMEIKINEDLLSIMMLYSLNASYENFRIAIETRDMLPTPEDLKIKIIEESEARGKDSNQSEGAFYNKKKVHAHKNSPYCKICKKNGHTTFNCYKNKYKNNSDNKTIYKNNNEHSGTSSTYLAKETCLSTNLNVKNKNIWCLDSGSTSHMCSDERKFVEMDDSNCVSLQLASSSQTAPVNGKGTVKISIKQNDDINLINTLHVPNLTTNLLSVSKFTDKGLSVIFTKNKAIIKHPKGKTVMKANRKNNLYYVEELNNYSEEFCNQIYDNEMNIWHKKLGHLNENDLNMIKEKLKKNFEVKDLGQLKYCLGIQFDYENDTIRMSQTNYINEILNKFNMNDCKAVKTPMETKLVLNKIEKKDVNIPYQNLIGALMYLSVATRPDISHAVSYLSQFNDCYGNEHWLAAKRVLRYLQGTKHLKLTFNKIKEPMLAYADANWGSCQLDRRSYTGYCFKWSGCIVSWEARKQKTVALSTAEAEYMAMTECAKEALHLKQLLKDMNNEQEYINILNDNQAAQRLSINPIISSKSKHIHIKQHFIRQAVEEGNVKIHYVPTEDMTADIFTKALTTEKFIKCREELGLSA